MLGYDPATDPNRYNDEPHYRFYLSKEDDRPAVVCVQEHDYRDYDAARFIGSQSFPDEDTARAALERLLIDAAKLLGMMPDFLVVKD